jgi:hypothetical protein
MILFLHLVWVLITVLRFAGIIIVFAGVGMFGVYFIGGNARAARTGDGSVPRSSWLGAGPRKAIKIVFFGSTALLCAFLISLLLPDGT